MTATGLVRKESIEELCGHRERALELNSGYFFDGVKYLQAAEREIGAPSLFDLLGIDQLEAAE
jgi:hypothetical protein